MNRRIAWLLALDALLSLVAVRRLLTLRDAWERHAHALTVHEQLGAP